MIRTALPQVVRTVLQPIGGGDLLLGFLPEKFNRRLPDRFYFRARVQPGNDLVNR
jgi:hypothetical protein